jgi:histidine triad (HIT) family protein
MDDCIFCKIVKGEVAVEKEYEDETVLAFADNKPKAPIHLLIVPKKHVTDINEVDDVIWLKINEVALKLAESKKLAGFRLDNNTGSFAEVKHFHVHFISK